AAGGQQGTHPLLLVGSEGELAQVDAGDLAGFSRAHVDQVPRETRRGDATDPVVPEDVDRLGRIGVALPDPNGAGWRRGAEVQREREKNQGQASQRSERVTEARVNTGFHIGPPVLRAAGSDGDSVPWTGPAVNRHRLRGASGGPGRSVARGWKRPG